MYTKSDVSNVYRFWDVKVLNPARSVIFLCLVQTCTDLRPYAVDRPSASLCGTMISLLPYRVTDYLDLSSRMMIWRVL